MKRVPRNVPCYQRPQYLCVLSGRGGGALHHADDGLAVSAPAAPATAAMRRSSVGRRSVLYITCKNVIPQLLKKVDNKSFNCFCFKIRTFLLLLLYFGRLYQNIQPSSMILIAAMHRSLCYLFVISGAASPEPDSISGLPLVSVSTRTIMKVPAALILILDKTLV